MYYYLEIDAPPQTTEHTPIRETIKLSRGVLEFIDIGFPTWNARLGRCRIYYNSIMIIPFNRASWLSGHDTTLRIPLSLNLDADPFEITIEVNNLDDTYSHELSFGLSMKYTEIDNLTFRQDYPMVADTTQEQA